METHIHLHNTIHGIQKGGVIHYRNIKNDDDDNIINDDDSINMNSNTNIYNNNNDQHSDLKKRGKRSNDQPSQDSDTGTENTQRTMQAGQADLRGSCSENNSSENGSSGNSSSETGSSGNSSSEPSPSGNGSSGMCPAENMRENMPERREDARDSKLPAGGRRMEYLDLNLGHEVRRPCAYVSEDQMGGQHENERTYFWKTSPDAILRTAIRVFGVCMMGLGYGECVAHVCVCMCLCV